MGRNNKNIFIITIIMIAAIFALGLAFYNHQKNRMERQAERSLVAVAELKAKQITDWREERLNDAAALSEGPFLRGLLENFLESPDQAPAPQLVERFSSFKQNFNCSDIIILDPLGNVQFSLQNEKPYPIIKEAKQDLYTALETGKPLLTELHFDKDGSNPHIGVIAPIIGENGPIAAVVLHIDATEFLYPLIQMWPYPSESAETILVRRDGDSVLYLNNLRFKGNTALTLSVPLDREEVLAVLAVKGKEGIYSGRDYRGVEVISALKHIPESNLYIETKIDRAEALSEWNDRANFLWAVILFILVSVVAGAGFMAQRTSKKHYKSLFMAESSLRENLERYRVTMRSIGDAVIGTDAQGRVRMMNPVAETLTGWSEQDAAGKMLEDVFRIVNEDTHEPVENPVRRVVQEGKIIGLANHTMLIARDGQERPIADSAAPILDDKNNIIGTVLIFRDQTEERERQEAIIRSERFLRRRMELIDFAYDHSIHDILQKTLDIIGEETDSPIGFYHSVDVDQKNLTLQAWSTKTVKEFCKAEGHGMHYGIEQAGVWVDCVRERRPVIHNDYASLPHRKGLPEGHAPVIRELVVPVMREGLIAAIVGIGNKPIVYSEKDVDFANFFADVSWELVLRKTSEEQLRKNEAILSRSQQIAHVGSWELDVTQNRLIWSDETYRIFGIAPNTFPATYEAFLDMVHPEDKKLVDAAYSDSLQDEKEGYEIGHRIVRKDNGETRHVIEKCIHERDLHGQIIRSVGMVQDITRRKLMEKSLRESEEFFKRMFMDSPIGIELYDKSGVFQTANDKCLDIFGIQSASAIKNFNLFEDPNVTDEMKSRLRRGETVRYEHEFSFDIVRSHSLYETSRTGTIWIDVLISPLVIDDELNGYLVHVEEITDRKTAQESIIAANKKLDTLWRISSLQGADLQTISDHILETIGEITNSKYGFYGFINQDESAMTIHSWSGNAMSDCAMGNKPTKFPIIESGIWAEAVRRREPFILNDYDSAMDGKKGLPEGHVPLKNLMVVPHFTGDRITALAAVANRITDYSDEDVRQINLFLTSVQAITDAKRAEDALRESENQYRTLFNQSTEGVYLHDFDGRILDANEMACKQSGYARDELLRMTVFDLHPQNSQGNLAKEEILKIWAEWPSDHRFTIDGEHIRKDGTGYPVYISTGIIHYENKNLMLAIIQDITDRKKAERDLLESRRRLQTAISAGNVGLWDWDLETNKVVFSQEWKRQIGYEDHEIGNDFAEWENRVHPDDLAVALETVDAALKESRPNYELEFRFRHKNGSWRTIFVQASVYFNDAGRPMRVMGSHVDITDRKKVEDSLKESEGQNRTILKTAIDGFILLDSFGKITRVNEAYCSMSGYSEKELHGITVQDLEGAEDAPDTAERMKSIIASGHGRFESRHRKKDGSFFDIEVSVTYLPDHGGQFVAFIRDITRRKKAQEDLANSEKRVRAKLEAVLSPEGDIGSLELADIINSEVVQSIMNEFYSLTGIGVGVLDLKGNVLAATGWQDICTKFHRIHPDTCRNCVESDTKLSVGVKEGEFREYKCKNGMWDISTPIIVGGKHLGNIFLGQFLYEDESPDYEFFRTRARKYGFEEEEYIASLDKVPRWSREMTANAMDFYAKLGGMISSLSYGNLKLARAIEERKEIDARMKMMAEMLDEAPNSITVHDTQGNFLFANKKTAEMHGYTAREFMAINLHELDVPESEALIEERLKLIAKNGEASFETAHFRKDGTLLPLHIFAKKVTWGGIPTILSIATDITERKMVQEALKASEKRFMDVLYSSSDAILLIGDNIFIDCNEATAKMLGYDTREEFLQTHPSKLSPPVQPDGRVSFEKAEEMMHTAFDKGFHRFEWMHRRANGEDFPVEVSLTPIVHEGKSLLYCVWRDITVQKRMEEEKKKLQAQLYQAQKMEAIGQLAGGMAHDFNNMLGVIMSAAELAKLDIMEDSPAREELEAINDAVKRARELTMKLLTFARKDKINVRKVKMSTLVNDLYGLLKRTVPKSVDIIVNVKDNSVINCDGNQIQQALVNVCNNAVDAMPSGGKLLIEADAAKVAEGICPDCGKEFMGGYVLIQISDIGIGMTRDTIAKITEPFFTTKGIGKGTGLGLSVTLGIIHSHNGHLHVYSEPDKGTCVKIYLPLTGSMAVSDEIRPIEKSFKGTETILVIDDEELMLQLAGKMLSRNGYRPLLAGGGDTAIELYKKHMDDISVVVLDLMMPGMDGTEVNRRLKDLNPDVKIVFSSGFSADGMASELLRDKHRGFVQKPFEMSTLCGEIRAQIMSDN